MSDYNKATNFSAKDSLPTGNSGKIVKGTEIDTELTAISAAIASKADTTSPIFLGTPAAPTATFGSNTTQIANTAFVQTAIASAFPSGGIVLWSGTIATIPSGWYLCNGSNGTPDLRDRFVIGASSDSGLSAKTNVTGSLTLSGGSKDAIAVSHTHTATSSVTDPGHVHPPLSPMTYFGGSPNNGQGIRGDVAQGTTTSTTGSATTGISVTTTVASSGSSGTDANLPPYYALAYIMKA